MKLYTGGGDRGKTSLFDGRRVSKSHRRIEVCGELDELNSFLGYLVSVLPDAGGGLAAELRGVQATLMHIAAAVSGLAGHDRTAGKPFTRSVDASQLESAIDRLSAGLTELREFILPGGTSAAAAAQICRAVCRRVERRMVAQLSAADAARDSEGFDGALVYINRLSDYLFVVARACNKAAGQSDSLWDK